MKKIGINKKIFTTILAISVIALLLFAVTAIIGSTVFAQIAEEALVKQMEKTLSVQVTDKADFIDEKLSKIASDADYFADYASALYNGWDVLPPCNITIHETDVTESESFVLNILLPNNMTENQIPADMRAHMQKLCNISYALDAKADNMGLCVAIYVASEDYGYTLMYDKFPGQYSDFDPRMRSWYTSAKANGGVTWSEPYIDKASGGLMITCSAPFYDTTGRLAGVVGVDIAIGTINNSIVNVNFSDSGYAFAVNNRGEYVAHSEIETNGSGGEYQAISAKKQGQDAYNAIVDLMTQGKSGLVEENVDGILCFVAYEPINVTGWSVAIIIPKADVISSAVTTGRMITGITIAVFAAAFVLILAAVVVSSRKISTNLSNPIVELTRKVKALDGGNLEFRNTIHTGDEIESLSVAFEKMTVDLNNYIKNIATVTAEKERIGAELSIATQIQASMLPCIFPAFPLKKEFEIFASMQPAKEVGGDFYDFFLIDEDKLAIVIADVSGKGVPAALFMVIAKTLIKNHALAGKSVAEIMANANVQLCEGNNAGLFVTAWIGVLEISTGKLTYSNAGHNAPLIKRAGGKYEFLKSKPCFVLAGMEHSKYNQSETTLGEEDVLFLYTDGVTEATNAKGELLGNQKLLSALENCDSLNPADILGAVNRQINEFVVDEQQFDDITMLCLKINKR